MSTPFSSEQLAGIRDDVRHMVERTRDHERHLSGLVHTSEDVAGQATRESKVIAYTGNGSIPPPLARWFVAIVPKPSPPDVVLAAVQNAASV